MLTRKWIVTSVRRRASEARCEAAPRSCDSRDLRGSCAKKDRDAQRMHRFSTFLPHLFHRAVSLGLLAVFVCAIGVVRAQTIDAQSLYRVFLADGRALPSYGEYTLLSDRVAFVLIVGDPRGRHELQLVSLPLSSINVPRTQRYAEILRSRQYALTRGAADYSELSAGIELTLAEIAKQPDARQRLQMAQDARQRVI